MGFADNDTEIQSWISSPQVSAPKSSRSSEDSSASGTSSEWGFKEYRRPELLPTLDGDSGKQRISPVTEPIATENSSEAAPAFATAFEGDGESAPEGVARNVEQVPEESDEAGGPTAAHADATEEEELVASDDADDTDDDDDGAETVLSLASEPRSMVAGRDSLEEAVDQALANRVNLAKTSKSMVYDEKQ
jgi:hypothetical protein